MNIYCNNYNLLFHLILDFMIFNFVENVHSIINYTVRKLLCWVSFAETKGYTKTTERKNDRRNPQKAVFHGNSRWSLLMVSKYNKVQVHIYVLMVSAWQTPRKCNGVPCTQAWAKKRGRRDLLIFSDFPPINPITIYQANASL